MKSKENLIQMVKGTGSEDEGRKQIIKSMVNGKIKVWCKNKFNISESLEIVTKKRRGRRRRRRKEKKKRKEKRQKKKKAKAPQNLTCKNRDFWLVKREHSRYMLFTKATPETSSVSSQGDFIVK